MASIQASPPDVVRACRTWLLTTTRIITGWLDRESAGSIEQGWRRWPLPPISRSLVIFAHDLSAALASLVLAFLLREGGQAIGPTFDSSPTPCRCFLLWPGHHSSPSVCIGASGATPRSAISARSSRRRPGRFSCSSCVGLAVDRMTEVPRGGMGEPMADPDRAPVRHAARLPVRQVHGPARARGCPARRRSRATCPCCCTAAAPWRPCSSARSSRRRRPTCGWSASSRIRASRAGATCTTSRSSARQRTSIGSSPNSRFRASSRNAW